MPRAALMLTVALVAATAALPVRAQESGAAAAPPAIAAVQSDVFLVHVVGSWKDDGRHGFSRLVGLNSGGAVRLFAQWLDAAGATVATTELEGTGELPALPLADVRVDRSGSEVEVFFDLPDGALYVATIGRPGEGRFGPATN
jgi:hypothetical protein